jgi:hypothetical protein
MVAFPGVQGGAVSFPGEIGGNPVDLVQSSFVGTPGLPGASPASSGGFLQGLFNTGSNNPVSSILDGVTTTTDANGNTVSKSGNVTTTGSVSNQNWITQIFLRAVIIVLGFIFMAVGLSMFKSSAPIILEQTRRGIIKTGKKVVGVK